MEHHADFAVLVTGRLWVEPNRNEDGTPGEATGTLDRIVDSSGEGPPGRVAQGNILRCHSEMDDPGSSA
jgi:hypothetical protein